MVKVLVLAVAVLCVMLCTVAGAAMKFTDITDSTIVGDTADTRGTCLADYNDDGYLDIFVITPFSPFNLFRNDGNMHFTNITDSAGLGGIYGGKGSSMVDYDNDGDIDLPIVGYGEDLFFRNNGNGTFTNFTDSANFAQNDSAAGISAIWADYDNDGYADLFVTNWWGTSAFAVLYHNEGDGTFTDATSSAGIACFQGVGAAWFDYDDDGKMDLFVARYFGYKDHLYHNEGDGTFTEVGDSAGVALPDSSFGCVAGDVDGDGHLDLFVTGSRSLANILYHNNGDGTFTNVTSSAGIYVPGCGTGCVLQDFDSDGDLDLYVGNFNYKHQMFENDGTGKFTDVTAEAGVADSGYYRNGACITAGDLDNDGDIDIYCGNGGRNTLFRNDTETNQLVPNGMLVLKLEGTTSNRSAIGARVYVTTPAGTQVREVSGAFGAASMSTLSLHIGLGPYSSASVEIRWPSGWIERGVLSAGHYDLIEGMFPGVAEQTHRGPERLAVLHQNRPNPFSSSTSISYQIPAAGRVSVEIYDLAGRLVENVFDGTTTAGSHTVMWDGTAAGKNVPDGVYICRLATDSFSQAHKMVLVR